MKMKTKTETIGAPNTHKQTKNQPNGIPSHLWSRKLSPKPRREVPKWRNQMPDLALGKALS